jgi:hypothetical protein
MKRRLEVLTAVLVGCCVTAPAAAAASSPTVQTGSATRIKQTSALLGGAVNPNGSATRYVFQWGLTNAYGATGSFRSAGRGSRPVAAATTAAGLLPGTRYHFRLLAVSRFGFSAGADRTFKTAGHPPPGVATGPAIQLGQRFATLTGLVNPEGQATSWTFQFGTTPAYGVSTFGGSLPAGHTSVEVTSPIDGLAPGTIFHYRLVAVHGGSSTAYGADTTLMTYPLQRRVPHTSAHTTPGHLVGAPFAFTTAGILHTAGLPAAFACRGDAAVRVFRGRRPVRFVLAPIQPNCSFATQNVFLGLPPHPPGRSAVRLWVFVHFLGNGYLAPAHARPQQVLLIR